MPSWKPLKVESKEMALFQGVQVLMVNLKVLSSNNINNEELGVSWIQNLKNKQWIDMEQ